MKEALKKYRYVAWTAAIGLYILFFFIAESIVTPDSSYWVSYCALDDKIPFCEWFIFPYLLWFPYMIFVGILTIPKGRGPFCRYIWSLAGSFTVSVIFMLIFPNGQNLRPYELITEAERASRDVFLSYGEIRESIATALLRRLYTTDTNTNVLPSMHVIGSMIAYCGLCKLDIGRKKGVRAAGLLLAILISVSTCFVKQHSILDIFAGFFAGLIVCLFFFSFLENRMERKEPGGDKGGRRKREKAGGKAEKAEGGAEKAGSYNPLGKTDAESGTKIRKEKEEIG